LYITQPALSASIRELEEEIGVKIFTRSNKGIRVTEEGRGDTAGTGLSCPGGKRYADHRIYYSKRQCSLGVRKDVSRGAGKVQRAVRKNGGNAFVYVRERKRGGIHR
jgi:hypothetical protein